MCFQRKNSHNLTHFRKKSMGVTAQKLKEVLNLIKSKEGGNNFGKITIFERQITKDFFQRELSKTSPIFNREGGSQRKIMFFKNIITIHVYVLIQKIQGSFSHTCSLAKIHRSSFFFYIGKKCKFTIIFQKKGEIFFF